MKISLSLICFHVALPRTKTMYVHVCIVNIYTQRELHVHRLVEHMLQTEECCGFESYLGQFK